MRRWLSPLSCLLPHFAKDDGEKVKPIPEVSCAEALLEEADPSSHIPPLLPPGYTRSPDKQGQGEPPAPAALSPGEEMPGMQPPGGSDAALIPPRAGTGN